MSSGDWRIWKVFSGIPPWNNNPLIATMGAASLAAIFTTPPTMTKGDPDTLLAFLNAFDFDRDTPKIYAKGVFTVDGESIDYKESAWEFMTPPDEDNPKLEALRAAGHKIILYHGQSDGVFSFNASVGWIEKLNANSGGYASSFARLFAVPGMNHCSHGPATDNFDMLSVIVDWVENGNPPERIIASVSSGNNEVPADWSPDRTRPLCPWPKVARYQGGDKEKAENFVCQLSRSMRRPLSKVDAVCAGAESAVERPDQNKLVDQPWRIISFGSAIGSTDHARRDLEKRHVNVGADSFGAELHCACGHNPSC